ncbi:MAG: hypothetical protein AMXMBFR13_46220 [Phycisphaerae bacterium]
MMQDEKDRLLTLLATNSRWCQHAEARDRDGHAVHYDDPDAVAWDLTGAVCVLFGWARALELFAQLERQLIGRKSASNRSFGMRNRDPQMCSMVAVQEFNDHTDTTYELVVARLKSLSVYQPESRNETGQALA